MKKIFLIIILFLISIDVSAESCADKKEVDKKIDAEYYCYYNSSGLEQDGYNVIVGISSDTESAYSDTGECGDAAWGAGTEPIKNWKYKDDDWDSDLDEDFSAKNYFNKNNKCPDMAYLHFVAFGGYNLYLINYDELEELLKTFTYKIAKDNEPKYYLVDFSFDTEEKMSCSYNVDMPENSSSSQNNYNVDIKLKFNANGNIINAKDLGSRTSVSSEVGANYRYVENYCPELFICPVVGKTHSAHGTAVAEYNFELYFADYYSIDERKGCKAIKCTNTDDSHCDHDAVESKICPTFQSFVEQYETNLNEYKSCYSAGCKSDEILKYEESKRKMSVYCSNVLKSLNFNNPCIERCLGLSNYIKTKETEAGINSILKGECGFSGKLVLFIANIVKWIKYIIPVLVIVLGILDFIKAIASEKDDEMKKAQKRFVTRLIAAALIFIAPFIIEFVLNKMGFDANGCGIIDL